MPRKHRELKPADENPQVTPVFTEPPPVSEEVRFQNIQQVRRFWNMTAAQWLSGRTIVAARYWTDEERAKITYGDRGNGVRLFLDNGVEVDVMCDDEGNGPGALHLFNPQNGKQEILPVVS